MCNSNEKRREEFIFILKEKLLKMEGMEEVIHEVLQIIDDIKNYLNGYNIFITAQGELGFDKLF